MLAELAEHVYTIEIVAMLDLRAKSDLGRMVIPVGRENAVQALQLPVKGADGSLDATDIIPVRFVPLTRDPATRPEGGP